jgi:hypothetical protein
MRINGRVERLERQTSEGRRCDCPIGPIVIVNEFVDPEGSTVRWTDAANRPMPGPPDIPSCNICEGRIRYVAVRRPVASEELAGVGKV